jgi:hypothetical protein
LQHLADGFGRDGRDHLQFDQLAGQQAQGPARATRGRIAAGQGEKLRLGAAVQPGRPHPRGAAVLQGALQALLDEEKTDPPGGAEMEVQCLGDGLIAQALVGLEQDAGVGQLAGRRATGADQAAQLVTLLVGEVHRMLAHARKLTRRRLTLQSYMDTLVGPCASWS